MDEFEESNLPYKVDVMDYLNAKGIFKQNIDQQRIKLLYFKQNRPTIISGDSV
jgi:hypothetical protein